MYGGKFGGNYIPETLKKPVDDLTKLFAKLRKDKKFIKERDLLQNICRCSNTIYKIGQFNRSSWWCSNLCKSSIRS